MSIADMGNRTRKVNGIGLGMQGGISHHIKDFAVYEENGSVIVRVERSEHAPSESIQYLSPLEAMSFAKAFERCAIAALKETA